MRTREQRRAELIARAKGTKQGIHTGIGVVTPVSKLIETLEALNHAALAASAVTIAPEPEAVTA